MLELGWLRRNVKAPCLLRPPYSRSMKASVFEDRFEEKLLKKLPKDHVIIMDNAAFHKKEVLQNIAGNTRRNWFSCRRSHLNTILLSTRGAFWSENFYGSGSQALDAVLAANELYQIELKMDNQISALSIVTRKTHKILKLNYNSFSFSKRVTPVFPEENLFRYVPDYFRDYRHFDCLFYTPLHLSVPPSIPHNEQKPLAYFPQGKQDAGSPLFHISDTSNSWLQKNAAGLSVLDKPAAHSVVIAR